MELDARSGKNFPMNDDDGISDIFGEDPDFCRFLNAHFFGASAERDCIGWKFHVVK